MKQRFDMAIFAGDGIGPGIMRLVLNIRTRFRWLGQRNDVLQVVANGKRSRVAVDAAPMRIEGA